MEESAGGKESAFAGRPRDRLLKREERRVRPGCSPSRPSAGRIPPPPVAAATARPLRRGRREVRCHFDGAERSDEHSRPEALRGFPFPSDAPEAG